MLTAERHARILQILEEKSMVSLEDLIKRIDVSESTLRRDLTALDEAGKLKKIRGGAAKIRDVFTAYEANVSQKVRKNSDEKRAIAKYAAALINNDDIVYIDAGTTTEKLVEEIPSDCQALFVTNGIVHACKLIKKGLKTYMIGGQIKAATEAIVGAFAVRDIEQFNFTKCFMGTNGISEKVGCTTPDPEEAMVKSEAVQRSYVPYFLADYSKFGKVYACSICSLEKACVITDRLPNPEWKEITVIKEVMS